MSNDYCNAQTLRDEIMRAMAMKKPLRMFEDCLDWYENQQGAKMDVEGRAKQVEETYLVERACCKGIELGIACNTKMYLGLTLQEIADEWDIEDPIDLLAVIAKAYQDGLKQKSGKMTGDSC